MSISSVSSLERPRDWKKDVGWQRLTIHTLGYLEFESTLPYLE